MERIQVDLGERSYPVLIGEGLLSRAGEALRQAMPPCALALVTDERVAPLYLQRVTDSLCAAGFRVVSRVLPQGEKTKSLDSLRALYSFLAENRISRSDAVAALGGGVIGDLTGLAAATWLRGVPFVQLPTTLLAQVDSSVGGKVAVDLPEGKNLVGAFHQPALVLCDPSALTTLTPEDWRSGLGEVVKVGCIMDEALFALLEACAPGGRAALMARMDEILRHCIRDKAEVVTRDERDTGLRMTLNFGHTIAHAVETCQHYEGLRHGEAVAVGMAVITRLSERRGLTEAGTAARLDRLLAALGLPLRLPEIPEAELIRAMGADKKNLDGALNLLLLRRIGACETVRAGADWFRGMAEA